MNSRSIQHFFPLKPHRARAFDLLLIFALLALLSLPCQAQANNSIPDIKFELLSTRNGLIQNGVSSMLQDHRGFLWIGTRNGLDRYDGSRFKHFHRDFQEPNTLPANLIRCLMEDRSGMLWVGTLNGLARLKLKTEVITRFVHDENRPDSLPPGPIYQLLEDHQGNIWVGPSSGLFRFDAKSGGFIQYTQERGFARNVDVFSMAVGKSSQGIWIGSNSGLYYFDPLEKKTLHFEHEPKDANSLSNNQIDALEYGADGNLWIGTGAGLCRMDSTTHELTRIDLLDPKTGRQPKATSLKLDSRGVLWVTTRSGVTVYNPSNGDRRHLHHNPADNRGLPDENVNVVIEDSADIVWMGTFGGGVVKYNRASEMIAHVKPDPNKAAGFNSNMIVEFNEASDGRIWMGGYTGRLSLYDPRGGTFEHIQLEEAKPRSNGEYSLTSILEDEGRLWLGTAGGLFSLDLETRAITQHAHSPDENGKEVIPVINSMVFDPKGRLWGATWNGLFCYDRQSGAWKTFKHDPDNPASLALNTTCTLLLDGKGRLWVGILGAGADTYDLYNGVFTHHPYSLENLRMLGSTDVLCFLEDHQGGIWLGTHGGGLYHYQEADGSFLRYTRKDGLFNEKIFSMVEDDNGLLWLATNQGISRFDPKTKKFKNLDLTYNLQANAYNREAALKTRAGSIYMAGLNGFNILEPTQIAESAFQPRVVFTGLEILNKPVKLATGIIETKGLTLSHTDRAITFQFAVLDFRSPGKNQFSYKLGDTTEDWIPLGNKGELTFPKLNPGNYTLYVRGSNFEGAWSDKQAQLQVLVPPPWWRTVWALLLYVAALCLFVYLLIHHQKVKLNRERSLNEKLRQVDRLKDEFLANTSHELRTPLHGIVGLAETLLAGAVGRLDRTLQVNLNLIITCGRRLENLVNDILDLSKIRNRELTIVQSQVDLACLVDLVLNVCSPLASHKNLLLSSSIPVDFPPVFADEARLEQILFNLVGNAIKFTEKGFVRVSATAADGFASVKIEDSGIGFQQKMVEVLFESFRQGDGSNARGFEGAGLGLTITRELVIKHGGQIRAESSPGNGATFFFSMPLTKPRASVNEVPFSTTTKIITSEPLTPVPVINSTLPFADEKRRFEILAVDDEPANRQLLANMLCQQHYGVTLADNGQEALDLVETRTFDLVLLDVMMPKLSGFEVCRRLRKNYSIQELPIIFLTAKTRIHDLIQGFEVGANDYVNKPFSREALLSRIRPHLELLDINRNLENLVTLRTHSLALQTRELQTLDSIVKTINREMEPSGLLPALLEQGVALFPKAHGGAILMHDEKEPSFSAVVTQPQSGFLRGHVFPAEGIEDLFMNREHRLADHYYAISLDDLPVSATSGVSRDDWLVCTDFSFEGRLDGFLLLLTSENPHNFPMDEVSRLLRYREHAVSALARVRMLAELEVRRNDLVVAAHHVGRSENARTVLHQMGNNLNSINTSVTLLMEVLTTNRWRHLADKLGSALDRPKDLASYLQEDRNGRRAAETLKCLFDRLDRRDVSLNNEVTRLQEHLNTMLYALREQHQLSDVAEPAQRGDLNRLIRNIVNGERRDPNLQIRFELETVPPFFFPKIKLKQVILILFRNARELIEVQEDHENDLLELQTKQVDDQIKIRISDNGIGIAAADRESAFGQGYATTKGLGKSLHHGANLVREMGGSIEIVSPEEGFTTAIVINLPMVVEAG